MDEHAWWQRYIIDGFRRGAARAFDDTRPQVREWQESAEAQQRLAWYNGTREEFLRSSFNWPVSQEKVKLLASRTFTDLKGVTDSMAARISHTLVDGLTKGDNPRVIGKALVKEVSVGKVRSQTIARTEIIRTHAEGQLDAFDRLGVTEVGVMSEWLTAGDDHVCKLCHPLEGVVLKVSEARGLLPRHPNCRCAWTPANLGEDQSNQKRSRKSIFGAFKSSYRAEMPKTKERTLQEQIDLSPWGAADKKISKTRPESPV
jgi:SPP1 gp7 family putative phage head morphogenesis protein